MISQGSIQQHTYEFEREGTTSALLSFRVTAQMVPKVKVLGVFSREDGELVADLIEIPVACSLPNQVRWLLLVSCACDESYTIIQCYYILHLYGIESIQSSLVSLKHSKMLPPATKACQCIVKLKTTTSSILFCFSLLSTYHAFNLLTQ